MKCAQCGNDLAANDRFCGECGAPRVAPPTPATESRAARSRRPRRWIAIIGGALLVGLVATLIGLRRLLPPSQLGFSGGSQTATLSLTSRAAQSPTLAPMTGPFSAPSSPSATIDPELIAVPANGRIAFKDAAVNFTLPGDWFYKPLGDTLWMQPPTAEGRRHLLLDSFQPVSGSSSAADELRHWLNVHNDITWTPLTTEKTAVGDLVWSVGKSTTVMPIYAAIQGPLRDGQVLYWWGQAPDNVWTQALPVFQQISRSTAHAQP